MMPLVKRMVHELAQIVREASTIVVRPSARMIRPISPAAVMLPPGLSSDTPEICLARIRSRKSRNLYWSPSKIWPLSAIKRPSSDNSQGVADDRCAADAIATAAQTMLRDSLDLISVMTASPYQEKGNPVRGPLGPWAPDLKSTRSRAPSKKKTLHEMLGLRLAYFRS